MKCITPINIKIEGQLDANGYSHHLLPCGKCPPCLRKRAAQWIFRLQQEKMVSRTSAFLTMTYEEDNMSFDVNTGVVSINSEDHKKWIKRLRSDVSRKGWQHKIKYYGCSEYGSDFGRPHFHYIMFNIPDEYLVGQYDRDRRALIYPDLERIWENGIVHVGTAEGRSMAYVTGYLQKNVGKDGNYYGQEKERSYMSKGLGKGFLKPNTVMYYKKKLNPYMIWQDGQKLSMPRYYKNKIYSQEEVNIIKTKAFEWNEENPIFETAKQEYEFAKGEFRRQIKLNQFKKR